MTDEKEVLPVDLETPEDEVIDDEIEDDLDEGEGAKPEPNETAEQKDARIAKLEERNGKLWARLQRDKSKPAPAKPAPAKKAETTTGLTREEGILYSKGFEDDEVEYAQKVATLQGVRLTEAVKDPLFTTWKSNKEADQKKQLHSLALLKEPERLSKSPSTLPVSPMKITRLCSRRWSASIIRCDADYPIINKHHGIPNWHRVVNHSCRNDPAVVGI